MYLFIFSRIQGGLWEKLLFYSLLLPINGANMEWSDKQCFVPEGVMISKVF